MRAKNFFETVKTKKDAVMGIASAVAIAVMTNPMASANGKGQMVSLINTILPYLNIIGIPIAVVGGFKLVMAFRNDQGDAVPAAARDLAIGIVICLFSTIGAAIMGSL